MFTSLASWENLLSAYRQAARGKRGHPSVAAFEHRLEDRLATLRRELLSRTYQPGGYTSFFIREPKRRLISAAPFRDRVVHHALVNVLGPLFEPSFVRDSYANRQGKGTHRALDRCQRLARRFSYVLQVDVRQFFPSVDHLLLRALLGRKVRDSGVLWLIDQVLASGQEVLSEAYEMVFFPGDDLFAVNRPRGLPIGNLTSQFWGNVYLSTIDHFVARELRGPGYVRYVDDLLLFGDDKASLWQAHARLRARLESLRLTLHSGAHPRPVREGIPFLGFVVYPDRRKVKRRKRVQFERRWRRLTRGAERGQHGAEQLAASLRGWLNHVRYGNTTGLQRALVGKVPAGITVYLKL